MGQINVAAADVYGHQMHCRLLRRDESRAPTKTNDIVGYTSAVQQLSTRCRCIIGIAIYNLRHGK